MQNDMKEERKLMEENTERLLNRMEEVKRKQEETAEKQEKVNKEQRETAEKQEKMMQVMEGFMNKLKKYE